MKRFHELPNAKRKRRWMRYSVRGMLLLVTVFAVWLGVLVHPINKQKQVVAWVRDQKGEFYYDFEWDHETGAPIEDATPPGPDWLRDLIGIDYFADVVMVDLSGTGNPDVTPLLELESLQVLDLSFTPVSDLTPLSGMQRLRYLDLAHSSVSNLTPLPGLKIVEIHLAHYQKVTMSYELKRRVFR
jgi:hypothetical protein